MLNKNVVEYYRTHGYENYFSEEMRSELIKFAPKFNGILNEWKFVSELPHGFTISNKIMIEKCIYEIRFSVWLKNFNFILLFENEKLYFNYNIIGTTILCELKNKNTNKTVYYDSRVVMKKNVEFEKYAQIFANYKNVMCQYSSLLKLYFYVEIINDEDEPKKIETYIKKTINCNSNSFLFLMNKIKNAWVD